MGTQLTVRCVSSLYLPLRLKHIEARHHTCMTAVSGWTVPPSYMYDGGFIIPVF